MGYGSSVSPQVRSATDWVQKFYFLFMFIYALFFVCTVAKKYCCTMQVKRRFGVFFSLVISFVRYIKILNKENLVGNAKVHHKYNNTTV